MIIFVELY